MIKFSLRLKELRQCKKLSQQNLADCIGVSKSSINMYERGEREPGLETLEIIADYFNVDLDYLIGKTDIPNRCVLDLTSSASNIAILNRYSKLNYIGKQKADEYITDLSEQPKYTTMDSGNIAEDIAKEIQRAIALGEKHTSKR